MSAEKIYPASPIKPNSPIKPRRARATRSEMNTRISRLVEIVTEHNPMTVRSAYYLAEVRRIVGKTDSDYDKIQDALTTLRRDGVIPYEWIIDEGRHTRQPFTVDGLTQALNETRKQHRKDPWQKIPEYVQIWVEKNALIGVLQPVTDEYAVALNVAVGYSSISFLYQAAQQLVAMDSPVYIYQFGDLDPSGAHAAEVIERELRGFAPEAEIHFERVAVTPDQVRQWNLPTRDTKKTDPRYAWFRKTYADYPAIAGSALSVELDAIPPNDLRALVRATIEKHLPRHVLDAANAEGEHEKAYLGRMLDNFIESRRRRTYTLCGSDHVDALYPASPINGGAP